MGNAATPSDGFDQLFGALTALTDSVSSIPDLDAADVQAVSDNAAYFGTSPEGALAIALQPASDATDAALSDYATVVPPSANPTQPIPPQGTTPTPQPTPDCSAPSGVFVHQLAAMPLGSQSIQIQIDFSAHQKGLVGDLFVALYCGDATVFSVQKTVQLQPQRGGIGVETVVTTLYLTVTPSQTGLFKAIVKETSTETPGNVAVDTFTYWSVQINP